MAKFPAGYQNNTIRDNGGTLSTSISNGSNTLVSSDENYTVVRSIYTTVPIGKISTDTKMTLPVFTPLTYAYNCICIGDAFTLAKQVTKSTQSINFYGLNSSVDSHILKNSEWGAVAYLTHSQYGRNGVEPNINNYYDGTISNIRKSVTGSYVDGTDNPSENLLGKPWYEETIGMLGSSTGNRTGVYDLNGCVEEMTAGYITNGEANLNTYKGSSNWVKTGVNEKGYETLSTEYFTIYPYDKSDNNERNWTIYKGLKSANYGYGDAILETSIEGNNDTGSWHNDYAKFIYSTSPFFVRGRGTRASSGVFAFVNFTGQQGDSRSFRVSIIP